MNHLPINQRKLKNLVKQSKHFNIFPIYWPNYLYESGQHPITDLISELVKECADYLSAMTEQETYSLIKSIPPGIRMFIEPDCTPEEGISLERIGIYYLIAQALLVCLSFKEVIKNDLEKSEVLRIYPELVSKLDRNGLPNIEEETVLMDGGIKYRDHILHYHQFLRRGYTSNPNFDFLGRFINCYNKTRSYNQFHIAIDHSRIMPKEFYQQIMELDTWFGPRFDLENIDDPKAIGLTVVKRNKGVVYNLINSLDRTEFFWSFHNCIKTLEIEEISNVDYQFDHYYINRYIHSERDIQKQVLRHFDGSAKVYLQNSYENRFNSNMPSQPKCHSKVKLFRVDGDIAIDDWIELTSFFYKSNEMIIEYFDPEQFKKIFKRRAA